MDTEYLRHICCEGIPFDKNSSNKLSMASAYTFELLNKHDFLLAEFVLTWQKMCNAKGISINLKPLIQSLYFILNSFHIQYDLPSMIGRPNRNGKPCIHVFFNESISHLITICLTSEAYKHILTHYSDKDINILELIGIIQKEIKKYKSDSLSYKRIDYIQSNYKDKKEIKKILENDLILNKIRLFHIAMKSMILLCNLDKNIGNILCDLLEIIIQNVHEYQQKEIHINQFNENVKALGLDYTYLKPFWSMCINE